MFGLVGRGLTKQRKTGCAIILNQIPISFDFAALTTTFITNLEQLALLIHLAADLAGITVVTTSQLLDIGPVVIRGALNV